ncbi:MULTISPECIES: arylsulfatase [unclassified Streptomyces]|uniref:arylsulfatase n=1 Tax=unclassified Streptomyces TaxID=2593676 RepID=UPI001BE7D2D6|nr:MULTISPECIES: arylsulfatase [unclassified Streptomyces]MBT2403092.1 arylsulfatase [Streptomyces sp. ISL-21]MBT2457606.1 arylsulfatase [Streptomyces sp. ISL-86]MBT2610231.1 arylsulfatase [Streptomyces sp. ISL-87]
MVTELVLLHTSPVHVPVFDALRDRQHAGAVLRHLVVPELLDRARAEGPESVRPALRVLLAGAGAGAVPAPVLVTCSTIGAVAESLAPVLGTPVLRVDRPMAAAAVRTGPRIAVLAALESTLAPTEALLAEEAAGRSVSIRTHVVAGAWDRFEAGDTAGCLGLVAAAADAVTDADVIVLAQVSMAGAADLTMTGTPVLSSPARGLAAAVLLAAGGTVDPGRRGPGVPPTAAGR